MISTVLAIALAAGSGSGTDWVWTLYADAEPVVLAEEIADTDRLRATLECRPGSGAVTVSLYEAGSAQPGFVTIRSGNASATSAAEVADGHASFALRTDHPVFAALIGGRRATIGGLGADRTLDLSAATERRRFAMLCG